MERTLATLGSMVLSWCWRSPAQAGPQTAQVPVPTSGSQSRRVPLQRLLVAVPDADALTEPSSLAALTTRLHVADPAATPIVMLPEDPARTIGSFRITIEPPAAPGDSVATVRIRVDGEDAVVAPVRPATGDPASPTRVTVIEVLGGVTGIVAHRTGLLELVPDELRLPTWRLPGDGADAVALDGAWWVLGPTRSAAEPLASPAPDRLRAQLAQDPVSAMRRLVDVSVGDVTGDGVPDIALSFRRPYRRTLLNASLPRRFWTDADGLSAHVGLYRMTDLSENLGRRHARSAGPSAGRVHGRPRGRVLDAAPPRIVSTSAWRWQAFAFLPLPELRGRGTPTCIDIDSDGRSEAAVIERSEGT